MDVETIELFKKSDLPKKGWIQRCFYCIYCETCVQKGIVNHKLSCKPHCHGSVIRH